MNKQKLIKTKLLKKISILMIVTLMLSSADFNIYANPYNEPQETTQYYEENVEDERNVDADNQELLEANEVEQPVRIDKSLSRPDPLASQNTKSREIVEEETTNTIENDKASKPRTISKEKGVILDNENGNSTDEEDFVPGIVIVGFYNSYTKAEVIKQFPELEIEKLVDQDKRLYNAVKSTSNPKKNDLQRLKGEIGKDFIITLKEKTKENVTTSIKIFKNNKNVKYAEPDYIIHPSTLPNDPSYSYQNGLGVIQAPLAWNTFTGSSSVKVGILDSGIDMTHLDLTDNINTQLAYNAHTETYTNLNDETGHGTHVAGIIGAKGNNALGITGVNWNVDLVPIKIAIDNEGNSSITSTVNGINYAIEKELPICNMSYGKYNMEIFFETLAEYPGLFVTSAGNSGMNVDNEELFDRLRELDNVITVASTDVTTGELSDFSNYGVKNVDIAAPGGNIYSTLPNNNYGYKSGTSMAAPFVTGVAALLKGDDSTLTTAQIKEILLSSVDYSTHLRGLVATGMLNAYKAINHTSDPNTLVVEPNDNETMSAAITRSIGNKIAANITHLKIIGDADMASTGTYQSSASVVLPNLTYVDAGCFTGTLCDRAFCNCGNITNVILPPDNCLLRSLTFFQCTSLNVIFRANSKRRLAGEADFSGMISSSSSGAPNAVGIQCFQGCTSLTTIRMTNTHKVKFSIYAFNNCTNLSTLYTEEYPKIVGEADLTDISNFSEGLFRGTAIATVKLPKDVAISNSSFENCSNMSVIQFHPNQTLSLSIGQNAFSNVNSSCVAYVNQLVYNNLNNLVIPRTSNDNIPIEVNALVIQPITNDTIEDAIDAYIGNINQNSIKHLVIKGSANMSYGGSANILPNLETADLSEYTGQAEKGTFSYCTHLKQVLYSSSNTKIPAWTYMGCSNLQAVQIDGKPKKVWLIDLSTITGTMGVNTQAFSGCSSIQTVRLPQNGTSIGIGQYTFNSCTNLMTIFRENNTSNTGNADLTGISSFGSGHAFDNTRIVSMDLPANTNISNGTFINCINLRVIRFDENQTTPCVIGYQSFYYVNSQCKAYMNTTLYNNSGFVLPRNDTDYIEKRAY